ncbi:hypothetical protein [Streptomyces sp. NRRL B-24484]|uniref:hypothetical protein n=1 Tax=Streptomyces sp. NRRL B-24484 TaxID=1463833 RepID=UPI0004C1C599|nr:hypothetical protein [Streptomyces sp. NRRL B-24484]
MSGGFDAELHEQLAEARRLRVRAREAGDEEQAQAYAGRITQLLRIAAHHGVVLDRAADEEEQD